MWNKFSCESRDMGKNRYLEVVPRFLLVWIHAEFKEMDWVYLCSIPVLSTKLTCLIACLLEPDSLQFQEQHTHGRFWPLVANDRATLKISRSFWSLRLQRWYLLVAAEVAPEHCLVSLVRSFTSVKWCRQYHVECWWMVDEQIYFLFSNH